MKYLALCLTGMVFLAGSLTAFADSLPNRQRRMALHFLEYSSTGQQLKEAYPWDPYLTVSFKDLGSRSYALEPQKNHVYVHANFLSAHPVYLSWIFAQAFVRARVHNIVENEGAESVPDFKATEKWAFGKSVKHWAAIDFEELEVTAQEADYVNYPDQDIADFPRRLELSVTDWGRRWRTQNLNKFLQSVVEREKHVEGEAVAIEDYLGREDVSEDQRRAARKIRAQWQKVRKKWRHFYPFNCIRCLRTNQ